MSDVPGQSGHALPFGQCSVRAKCRTRLVESKPSLAGVLQHQASATERHMSGPYHAARLARFGSSGGGDAWALGLEILVLESRNAVEPRLRRLQLRGKRQQGRFF